MYLSVHTYTYVSTHSPSNESSAMYCTVRLVVNMTVMLSPSLLGKAFAASDFFIIAILVFTWSASGFIPDKTNLTATSYLIGFEVSTA